MRTMDLLSWYARIKSSFLEENQKKNKKNMLNGGRNGVMTSCLSEMIDKNNYVDF